MHTNMAKMLPRSKILFTTLLQILLHRYFNSGAYTLRTLLTRATRLATGWWSFSYAKTYRLVSAGWGFLLEKSDSALGRSSPTTKAEIRLVVDRSDRRLWIVVCGPQTLTPVARRLWLIVDRRRWLSLSSHAL